MTKLRHICGWALLFSLMPVQATQGETGPVSGPVPGPVPAPDVAARAHFAEVRAGQMLEVMGEEENLRVVTRATALSSGQVGDVVRVRLETSGRLLMVRITAPGVAVIVGLKPAA